VRAVADKTRWDMIYGGDVPVPVNDTMGFWPDKGGDPSTEVSFTWKVPPEYCNSAGNLQGGILAAFADTLLGGAMSAQLPVDQYPALAEMKISIFRPAPADSTITGKGRVLKSGKRIAFAEAEIYDSDGNLIAKASATEVPANAPD
jgi:uncharacterized protein (TIGR00369 family)